jgi:hypothetical protein
MLNTFLATFLAIFIATAILTLASLPGWVRIPEKYRSRLFAALILQVVGSVVGFVSAGIQAGRASAGPSAAALTAERLTKRAWDWQYVNRNWRTKAIFSGDKTAMQFQATTYYRRKWGNEDSNTPIMTWRSEKPFALGDGTAIEFDAIQTILKNSKEVSGPDAADPGDRRLHLKLAPQTTISGTWRVVTDGKEIPYVGGMTFTKDSE